MYYIRRYTDCWAVHDDITGASRRLQPEEVEKLKIDFDSLCDEKVLTVYTDKIRSIGVNLENYLEKSATTKRQ